MLVSLSVFHAEVVTFLRAQDKPNSFPSPLSPDLDKGVTVVPPHKFLQAVKQLRWKALASWRELVLGKELQIWVCLSVGDRGKVDSFAWKNPNLTLILLAKDLTSFPGLFCPFFFKTWVFVPDKKRAYFKIPATTQSTEEYGRNMAFEWVYCIAASQPEDHIQRQNVRLAGRTWKTTRWGRGCQALHAYAFTSHADVHPKEFRWVCFDWAKVLRSFGHSFWRLLSFSKFIS